MSDVFKGRLRSTRGAVFFIVLMVIAVCVGLSVVSSQLAEILGLSASTPSTVLQPVQSWAKVFLWSRLAATSHPAAVVMAWGVGLMMLLVVLAIGMLLLWLVLRRQQPRDGHGSADWATREDIVAAGLLDGESSGNALIVGGWCKPTQPRLSAPEYLIHQGAESLIAFAPSGSAKTVTLAIPNLLCYESSVFVLDSKGELWDTTAGYRQQELGQRVLFHDPSDPSTVGARFNPLEEIDIQHETAVQAVQLVVTYLIPMPEKEGENAHFYHAARNVLVGVILYELLKARSESLATAQKVTISIRQILAALTQPGRTFKEYLELMADYTAGNSALALEVREIATEMLGKAEKEFSGIFSSMTVPLSIFRDPILARATAESDFRLLDLVESDRHVSFYLIIRPRDRDRLKHYYGLFVNLLFRTLTWETRQRSQQRKELLLMLDEFTSMPALPVVQQSMDVMRGFGLKAFIILQDIESLVSLYGQNETFTSNCKVHIAYTPSKNATAKLLSDMVGTTTVTETTGGRQRKTAAVIDSSHNESEAVHARALMTPDEVRRLKVPVINNQHRLVEAGDALVFVRGCKPIKGIQAPYFFDEELQRRANLPAPITLDIVERKVDASDLYRMEPPTPNVTVATDVERKTGAGVTD